MNKLNYKDLEIYKSLNKLKKTSDPKITVITVVYEGANSIEKTMKNIFNQNYKNIEYILVYTPSKDKTWEIILSYQSKIDKIIISHKKGIYQAFNCGIINATGDYINFMNSGDYFFSSNTLSKIFLDKKIYTNYDVIYGDCEILYPNFKRLIKCGNPKDIEKGMFFSHQSCFVKTSVHKKILFNTKYTYSADYDFFYKLIKMNKKFINCNKIVSKRSTGGFSDKNRIFTLRDNFYILNSYIIGLGLIIKIKYLLIIMFYSVLITFRSLVSEKLYNYIIRLIKT